MENIINVQIDKTFLGLTETNMLTIGLTLTDGTNPRGTIFNTGINLDESDAGLKIKDLFELVEVRRWEHLKGKYVRAKVEDNQIVAIGHLVRDIWLTKVK